MSAKGYAEEYERVTSQIVQSIYERVEGIAPEQVNCGKRNRWPGVSGYKHQVDVSVRGPRDLILVECKRWKRKVTVASVLVFFGRIHDIAPTFDGKIHGVIVTTLGFQSGACTMAEYCDIDLQLIRSANEFGFTYKKLRLFGLSGGIRPTGSLSAKIIRKDETVEELGELHTGEQ